MLGQLVDVFDQLGPFCFDRGELVILELFVQRVDSFRVPFGERARLRSTSPIFAKSR